MTAPSHGVAAVARVVALVVIVGAVGASAALTASQVVQAVRRPAVERPLISPSDMGRIKAAPESFAEIAVSYRPRVRQALGLDETALPDQATDMVLASVAAYEAVPYRWDSTIPPPPSRTAKALLTHAGLLCDEYVALALGLFEHTLRPGVRATIDVQGVGWRRDSPFKNHAQIMLAGVPVPLMLDPTLGLVARGSLADAFSPVPLKVWHLDGAWENEAAGPTSFRALVAGAYRKSTARPLSHRHMIYAFRGITPEARRATVDYGPKDFVKSAQAAPDGRAVLWVNAGGQLWRNDGDRNRLVSSGIADLVGNAAVVRAQDTQQRWSTVAAAPGSRDEVRDVRLRDVESGAAPLAGAVLRMAGWPGQPAADGRIRTVLEARTGVEPADDDGTSSFVLTTDGGLWVRRGDEAMGGLPRCGGHQGPVASIHPTYGSNRGRVIFVRFVEHGLLCAATADGHLRYVHSQVKDFVLGYGGFTVTVLTEGGRVYSADFDDQAVVATDWQVPFVPDAPPYVSLRTADYGATVEATSATPGSPVSRAGASTF